MWAKQYENYPNILRELSIVFIPANITTKGALAVNSIVENILKMPNEEIQTQRNQINAGFYANVSHSLIDRVNKALDSFIELFQSPLNDTLKQDLHENVMMYWEDLQLCGGITSNLDLVSRQRPSK